MTLSAKGRTKKGMRIENKFKGELNRHFERLGSGLFARRVGGSGARAYRDGGLDETKQGDVRILRPDGHCVERVEVKGRDPSQKGNSVTHAMFARLLVGRRIVACRHDRGLFLVGVSPAAWQEWLVESGQAVPMQTVGLKTRGQRIEDIQDMAIELGSLWLEWGGVVFGTPKQLAELLEDAYGE